MNNAEKIKNDEIMIEAMKEEIAELEVISTDREPQYLDLYRGEPFCLYCFHEYNAGIYYGALNRYRNVLIVEQLKGNEDKVFSARWVLTDVDEVIAFCEKYNKKI